MKKLYYLASPYTHKHKKIKKVRADLATEAAVKLFKDEQVYTFSPIGYNSHWETYMLPGDWNFWESFDKCFIDHCDAVIVLMLDGWDVSVGVTAEIQYAKELNKEILYLNVYFTQSGELIFDAKDLNRIKLYDTVSTIKE